MGTSSKLSATPIYVLSVGLVVALASCGPQAPDARGGQAPRPEIFAPGSISTLAPEFSISFTPDGQTAYFNRASPNRASLAILRSNFSDAHWQPPTTASFSGEWLDVDPFVAPDGSRLYFSSTRPTTPGDSVLDFNTWVVLLSAGNEGEPTPLPEPLNSDSVEVFVSAARSATLYFSSNRDGVIRTYRASSDSVGAAVELVPIDMNLTGGVGNPAISSDEQYLVFVANIASGVGASDLFISTKTDGVWSPGRLLPEPVNSEFADFAPYWSSDGQYLYFTSERPGLAGSVADGTRPPGDIYRVSVASVLSR